MRGASKAASSKKCAQVWVSADYTIEGVPPGNH